MSDFDKKGGYRPRLGPKNPIPPWDRSSRPMRTTTEVIEAARLGEPCTEEELRLCIVSMRTTAVLSHMSHAKWSIDESLPLQVRLLAKNYWSSVNDGWNIPLDQRVGPEDRPGHPGLKHRKEVAEAVWDKAEEAAKKGSQ